MSEDKKKVNITLLSLKNIMIYIDLTTQFFFN